MINEIEIIRDENGFLKEINAHDWYLQFGNPFLNNGEVTEDAEFEVLPQPQLPPSNEIK